MLEVDLNAPLDEESFHSLIDSIARPIVDRGLESAAVLFLEMNKPLSFVASQSLMVAMPFLAPFVGAQRVADLGKMLKSRENVEVLIRRIEDMAAKKDQSKNAATAHDRLSRKPSRRVIPSAARNLLFGDHAQKADSSTPPCSARNDYSQRS